MSTLYSISEFAAKVGITQATLRNWHKNGSLIPAHISKGSHRYYSHEQFLSVSGKDKYLSTGKDIDVVGGKVVFISGGSGTLGNAITAKICDVAKKVIIFSRGELKQAEMQEKFVDKKNIRFMIGDIRDKERLMFALREVDICIHAACMKRVEKCTYDPFEAVKNNVIGSMNIVEACIENKIKKALMVSTDKACSPITLYGGTKFVSEQLFINGNNYSKRDGTVFTVSRYGNIFNSAGSFRILLEKQAKLGKVKITHKDMSRFFMSIGDAVDLNLFALNNSIGGEIFIPKLKAATILEFASTFCPDVPIEFIGLRGPEKIHEELISETEMLYTVDCGKYYKILPPNVNNEGLGWDREYPKEPTIKSFKYSSNAVEQFTPEELKEFEK